MCWRPHTLTLSLSLYVRGSRTVKTNRLERQLVFILVSFYIYIRRRNLHIPVWAFSFPFPCSIDGMIKVRSLKKHMERFNEVVNGLKEGKQEMAKQVQDLAAAIDALLAKIKVSQCQWLTSFMSLCLCWGLFRAGTFCTASLYVLIRGMFCRAHSLETQLPQT